MQAEDELERERRKDRDANEPRNYCLVKAISILISIAV
jgi:hypothetical protein